MTIDEVRELASGLDLDEVRFLDMYAHSVSSGGFVLREKSNNDCVFWDRKAGCTVYANRPRQCRTWPFWRGVVASPQHWARAARGCPGIGQGELHGDESIREMSESDGTSDVIPEL